MTKDETLKQALEASMEHEGNPELGKDGVDRHVKAITAIEEALAAPVQDLTLQEQLNKALADLDKANADWDKAYADRDKAYAEARRIKALMEKNT